MTMNNFANRLKGIPHEMQSHALDLPEHLIESGYVDESSQLLTDLYFIETKCAAGRTYNLIADYEATLNALPEYQEEKQKELEHEQRIKKYTEEMIAYARAWNDARERHAKNPEKHPLPKPEDITLPEIIPSVEPWSNEKIRKNTERSINNPTRLDRMRAFSQFVNSESYALIKFASHPGFCIQHAYNSASSGPVAKAADAIVNNRVDDFLLLRLPAQRLDYNPHPALLRTLVGHTDQISSVSLTSDGKIAVSGSDDKTLRVWDLESGECLRTLEGHTDKIGSVSLTPDSKIAVSGSGDKTLRVWDLESGGCLRTLEGHTDKIASVSLTPDCKIAVSGSGDKTLRVWDLESGECLRTLKGHRKTLKVDYQVNVSSVSVTPDSKIAVSGAYGDNRALVWDIQSGEVIRTLLGNGERVNSIITPDGQRIISESSFGLFEITHSKKSTILVWDLESEKPALIFHEAGYKTTSMSITPDGKKAICGNGDNTIKVWNLESGRHINLLAHESPVIKVRMSPDGKSAISQSVMNNERLWDVGSGECLGTSKSDLTSTTCIVTRTADERRDILNYSGNYPLYLVDVESRRTLRSLSHGSFLSNNIWHLKVTLDGRRAISVNSEGNFRLWDLESGKCIRTFDWGKIGGEKRIHIIPTSICLIPDEKRFVAGCYKGSLLIWNFESGDYIVSENEYTEKIIGIVVTPDGKRAISGGIDNIVRVWDLRSVECVETFERQAFPMCVSPDGKNIISTSPDNSISVWNIKSGEYVAFYQAKSDILSMSELSVRGDLACGTTGGEVILLRLRNFLMHSPVVTPYRIWLYGKACNWLFRLLGKKSKPGSWADNILGVCQWCGQHFSVPAEILDVIATIAHDANLSPNQSPCLELPAKTWDDPHLLSECPLCHKPLKFNPFVVDNRGRW